MDPEERIIQLLDGELGQEEIAEIEQLIADNPELEEQKELYEQIILAIRKNGEQSLRQELDGYLSDHLKSQTGQKSSAYKRYFFAGGIAASLVLGVMFYQSGEEPGNEIPDNWQINDIPAHIDSATHTIDSLQNEKDSLKEAQIKIDTLE